MSKTKNTNQVIVSGDGNTAFLYGTNALVVTETDSDKILKGTDQTPKEVTVGTQKYRGVAYWGEDNDLPDQIIEKIYRVPDVSAPLGFNIDLTYGDGIVYGKYIVDEKTGKRTFVPKYDHKEINEFLKNNDIRSYFLEQVTDMRTFFNCFPEIVLNGNRDKIVELNSLEASYSRWEVMNPKNGKIENHFYWNGWHELSVDMMNGDETKDIPPAVVTKVLDCKRPYRDLMQRLGKLENSEGKKIKTDKGNFRYIVPINFSTPGQFYYQKPYWYSIFEHWYDFVRSIPQFKKSLVKTMMTIKYVVKLHDQYFTSIFEEEKITDDKKKRARVLKEYQDINNFLSNPDNAGKAVITKYKSTPDGKEIVAMQIEAIDNKFTGGEYIKDIEQGSNMISFAMGVHPSLIGSAPGSNKSINGTEARELFIIKQALMKPYRDLLLKPLYLIRDFNNWGDDIYFEIMNLSLTTLDQGTGAVKSVGQENL